MAFKIRILDEKIDDKDLLDQIKRSVKDQLSVNDKEIDLDEAEIDQSLVEIDGEVVHQIQIKPKGSDKPINVHIDKKTGRKTLSVRG